MSILKELEHFHERYPLPHDEDEALAQLEQEAALRLAALMEDLGAEKQKELSAYIKFAEQAKAAGWHHAFRCGFLLSTELGCEIFGEIRRCTNEDTAHRLCTGFHHGAES